MAPVVDATSAPGGNGLWEVTRTGAVYAYGGAAFLGPEAPLDPGAPISGLSAEPASDGGYWLVGVDGAVYAYGAGFYGAG